MAGRVRATRTRGHRLRINLSRISPDPHYLKRFLVGEDVDCRITPATTGDKALAAILTTLFSVGGFGFAAWLAL